MGESDGSHSCRNIIHELNQDNPDDPGSYSVRPAAFGLNLELSC